MASTSFATNQDLELNKDNHSSAKLANLCDQDYEPEEDTDDEGDENEERTYRPNIECKYDGCGLSFRRQNMLDRHVYQKHCQEKQHLCPHEGCGRRYIIIDHLKRHIARFHEKKHLVKGVRIKCPNDSCDRYFNTQTNVRRHLRSFHENRKIYKCTECDFETEHKGSYSKHVQIHDPNRIIKPSYNVKYYYCPDCEVSPFNKWTELQKHRKVTHLPTCHVCQRTFKNRCNLKNHIKLHEAKEKDIRYTCTYDGCNKFYWQENNLNHHIQTVHEGIRLKCPVESCESTFTTSRKMKNHVKLHTQGNLVVERKPQAVRKDKGIKKGHTISTLAILTGIAGNVESKRKITDGVSKDIEMEYGSFTTTSDTDGEEVHVPRKFYIKTEIKDKSARN